MSGHDQSGEKTEAPTAKKLQDARAEGEIPKSNDLTTAVALLGFLLSLVLFSKSGVFQVSHSLTQIIADPEGILGRFHGSDFARNQSLISITPIVWLLLIPAAAALAALFAQNAITFSNKKLKPKLSKISPVSSLKNKFGATGLVEFAKSSSKLIIISLFVAAFLAYRNDELVALAHLSPKGVISAISFHTFSFMGFVCAILVIIGAIDLLWQYKNYFRKNMMSRKEIQDEHKDSEGDPHTKGQRRQRGYEIAMNQMLASVPDADVVIVNPTHYAVALKWSPNLGKPPVCLAKGVDEIAARIRASAQGADVPIYHSPATARSIFTKVKIGEVIPKGDFRAVAAAIRFAQNMRRK